MGFFEVIPFIDDKTKKTVLKMDYQMFEKENFPISFHNKTTNTNLSIIKEEPVEKSQVS